MQPVRVICKCVCACVLVECRKHFQSDVVICDVVDHAQSLKLFLHHFFTGLFCGFHIRATLPAGSIPHHHYRCRLAIPANSPFMHVCSPLL